MKMLNRILLVALPLMLCVAIMPGCDDKENATPTDTVDTLLATTPNLTIFRAALEKTGMNTYSRGGGPFTYFAPSDDAFKAAGINSPADLNAIDNNLLVQTLAYHIMAGRRSQIEIPAGPNAPTTMVGGLAIYNSRNTTGAYINGTKVVTADIQGSNGTIHVLEDVLTPPFTNIVATLAANPNFKLLVQGINKASLATTLSGTTVYTIFAPTNAAMVAGGYDSTTIANLTGTALTNFTNVLRYHLITGRLFSSEFKAATLKSVQGSNLSLTVAGGNKIKGIANANPFNITMSDFLASNGPIHTIDGVLRY